MTEQSSRLPTTESVVESQPPITAIAPSEAPSKDSGPMGAAPEQPIEPDLAEADVPGIEAEAVSESIPEEVTVDGTAVDLAGSTKKRIPPQAVVSQLVAAWPQAFFTEPRAVKPLAIGTLQQILANRPAELEGLNSQAIRSGIKFYTSRLSYHYGIVHNSHRITLAGEQADEVDEKAREFAKTQILAIGQQRAERRAAQNPPPVEGESLAGQGPDNAERKPRAFPGRRAKRSAPEAHASSAPASAQRSELGAEANPSAPRRDRPEGGRPNNAANATRNRPARRDQPKATEGANAPRSDTRSARAPEPVVENLSLEEKLARLAQHFGKSG
ncbi:MAG: ProQ/FinO family protein [Halothiobacillus sp.]